MTIQQIGFSTGKKRRDVDVEKGCVAILKRHGGVVHSEIYQSGNKLPNSQAVYIVLYFTSSLSLLRHRFGGNEKTCSWGIHITLEW